MTMVEFERNTRRPCTHGQRSKAMKSLFAFVFAVFMTSAASAQMGGWATPPCVGCTIQQKQQNDQYYFQQNLQRQQDQFNQQQQLLEQQRQQQLQDMQQRNRQYQQ